MRQSRDVSQGPVELPAPTITVVSSHSDTAKVSDERAFLNDNRHSSSCAWVRCISYFDVPPARVGTPRDSTMTIHLIADSIAASK
jgi:hypothetical protein